MDRLQNALMRRYSRPVSARNTSSRVPPRTCRPRQRVQSASAASTGAGRRVAMMVDTASAVTSSAPSMAAAACRRQRGRLHRDPSGRIQVADQFRGRPELQDLAVVHDRDPVAERFRLVHVVSREHHRLAAIIDGPQHIPQVPPGLRVQRCRRLVQEDDLRVVDQRARDGQPLRLAAGEFLRPGVRLVGECDQLEHLVHPLRRGAVQRGEGGQLFVGGQPFEEGRRLQLNADPVQQLGVPRPGRLAQHPRPCRSPLPAALR